MANLELSIAWRYLRSRRGSKLLSLISVIAIGGVWVGVSALVVIMGVMNGLQKDLQEKIRIGSPDIRIMPYDDGMRMRSWREIMEKAKTVKGVVKAAPFLQTQGIAGRIGGTQHGAAIVGIQPEGVPGADVTAIRDHKTFGDFKFRTPDGSNRGAVLGSILATSLGAFPGDTLRLLGQTDELDPITGQARTTDMMFIVTGLFDTGLYEYDATYMYIDLAAAQQFAGFGGDVTGLELSVDDQWNSRIIADSLESSLHEQVRMMDWQEQNKPLFQALKLEKLGMGIILLLIVIIAAFNIVSTLTMVVADKTREIGILRAMGLPAKSVRRIFVWQGLVIGAIGTGGGLLLGLIIAFVMVQLEWPRLDQQIYFIDHVPVIVSAFEVAMVALASMVIAGVATLYPAGQAAHLYPVDAIRHE
ncbi:MAG: ABC transporter permease [Phycisphaerae bacterium]|nr:ABC transporter permease [Gemmatimonadaceae bacterium]